jgi:hypothetical protein
MNGVVRENLCREKGEGYRNPKSLTLKYEWHQSTASMHPLNGTVIDGTVRGKLGRPPERSWSRDVIPVLVSSPQVPVSKCAVRVSGIHILFPFAEGQY